MLNILEAIKCRDVNLVRDILDSDPLAIQSRSGGGLTPLHVAAYHSRSVAIVKLLLDRGADPNEGPPLTTPLIKALGGMDEADEADMPIQEAIIELLLSSGASVHEMSGLIPPMVTAVLDGRLGATKLMMPRWGDVNAEDLDGLTLLHRAAYKGHIDVVKYLLANGACPDLPDCDGLTAADFADGMGHSDVADLLNGADYDPDNYLDDDSLTLSFQSAVENASVKEIGRCLRIYPPLADARLNGTPLICSLAGMGSLEAVQLLTLYGALVNAQDSAGHMALDYAEHYEHADIVDFLARAGRITDNSELRMFARAEYVRAWLSKR